MHGIAPRRRAFAGALSVSSIQIEDHDTLGRDERASGLGDIQLGLKYRFWDDGVEAALLGAVKAPTGDTSDDDRSGEKIAPELQPGTGSWDLTAGVAVSKRLTDRLSLTHAIQYTYKDEGAQDEKLGDALRSDLGMTCSLRPAGAVPNLTAGLELQHHWVQRDRSRDDRKVLDSGGTTILLSPGLAAQLTKSVNLYCAMPIPIYQNLGGEHEELKFSLLSGVSWQF